VKLHGREDVALATVADARHVVLVLAGDRVAAYGIAPRSR
jgi:hypothetical protein